MKFINIRNNQFIIYLVFLAIFILGAIVYKDYGLCLDDEWYRRNGEFYYFYIKELINGKSILSSTELKLLYQQYYGSSGIIDHPAMFEFLLAAIVDLLNINNINEIYEVSHFLNFFIFYLSLIFFYKLVSKKFNSSLYGLASVIILFFSPRLFAESFYNSRDIFFLSLFIFNIYSAYNFLIEQNFKNVFLFSITSAILIDAKLLGIIPPILFVFFYYINTLPKNNYVKSDIKYLFLIFPLTIFFIYIFWPYLWNDPIINFLDTFENISRAQHSVVTINYYLGEYIASNNSPWHYRIIWFLITTPTFVVFFFVIGFVLLLSKLIKRILEIEEINDDIWKNFNELFEFYLLLILLILILITTKFDPAQFGGWRHLYFLYPIIIIFAIYGYKSLFNVLNYFTVKVVLIFLVTINFIYILSWSFINHPHQHVYFNYIVKNVAAKNFDLDYWGVSNIHSLKYILKENKNTPLKIATISNSSLEVSKLLLNKIDRKNILLVGEPYEADYLIDNYMKKKRNNFAIDNNNYKKNFEIVVNGIPINTVYKKIY